MKMDKKSWGYRAEARLEDFLSVKTLIRGIIENYFEVSNSVKSKMFSFIFIQLKIGQKW